MNPSTLVLTRSDVVRLLRLTDCIEAVERVFRSQAEGEVQPPGVLGFHVAEGGFHIKTAEHGNQVATKINANFPGNPAKHGLPTIQGVVTLFDANQGMLLALMDSIEVTAQRTAAASAVAARYLARQTAATATIVGCGVQGRFQLEAIQLVRPLTRAFAVDADIQRSERFARETTETLGLRVEPADLKSALEASEIIVTCTTSREAFLAPGMVRPGTFIAAVGADNPEKQEIAPALMASSTVVVDSLEQCLAIGDLHHAVVSGAMHQSQVHGTLGEVIAGLRPGRRSEAEIVVFDSTGTALQDVAAATLVYERALRDGIGRSITLGG
jgi:alanine dehydrogenase